MLLFFKFAFYATVYGSLLYALILVLAAVWTVLDFLISCFCFIFGIKRKEKPKPDPFLEALHHVRFLEKERIQKNYRAGWLYYQCVDNPLYFEALEHLQETGEIEAPPKRRNSSRGESTESKTSTPETRPFDPYTVLGVPRGASQEEVRSHYKEQMKLYHPDRVAHLGAELQKLALEKSQDIQKAYSMLAA